MSLSPRPRLLCDENVPAKVKEVLALQGFDGAKKLNTVKELHARMKHVNVMKGERPTKSFEDVWRLIEDVRSDPKAMKLLDKLIKSHTS